MECEIHNVEDHLVINLPISSSFFPICQCGGLFRDQNLCSIFVQQELHGLVGKCCEGREEGAAIGERQLHSSKDVDIVTKQQKNAVVIAFSITT